MMPAHPGTLGGPNRGPPTPRGERGVGRLWNTSKLGGVSLNLVIEELGRSLEEGGWCWSIYTDPVASAPSAGPAGGSPLLLSQQRGECAWVDQMPEGAP